MYERKTISLNDCQLHLNVLYCKYRDMTKTLFLPHTSLVIGLTLSVFILPCTQGQLALTSTIEAYQDLFT